MLQFCITKFFFVLTFENAVKLTHQYILSKIKIKAVTKVLLLHLDRQDVNRYKLFDSKAKHADNI